MKRQERLVKGLLKIGEVAREAGVLPSTVRYYTQIGLLSPASHTPGGYRLYNSKDTLRRLEEIKRINSHRPSLNEIKNILSKKFA